MPFRLCVCVCSAGVQFVTVSAFPLDLAIPISGLILTGMVCSIHIIPFPDYNTMLIS